MIYDALAPACAELATLYTELSNILDRAFPDIRITLLREKDHQI